MTRHASKASQQASQDSEDLEDSEDSDVDASIRCPNCGEVKAAVDAAVAISLTLGVTEPSESGLGGTVVMLVTRPGADPLVIHATPEVVRSTGPNPGSFLRPTMVPVLVHAWREYGSGKVSWEQVVEPAQRLAENGYSLGRFRHLMMVKEYRRLEGDSVARFRALGPGYAFWAENEFTGRRVSPCRTSSHPSGATACDDG